LPLAAIARERAITCEEVFELRESATEVLQRVRALDAREEAALLERLRDRGVS
jgi:hypothetical protein